MLLSLEAERIISGFSELVANAVTQSLWPVLSNLQQGDIHLEEFLLERENLPCCECKTQSNDEMKETEIRDVPEPDQEETRRSSHTHIMVQFRIRIHFSPSYNGVQVSR